MILPNHNEKALVPYTPSKLSVIFSCFNLVFYTRKSYYLLFLCLFFVSSALARCISVYNNDVMSLFFADLRALNCNTPNKFIIIHCCVAFLAFFSAFTPFSIPISLFASAHSFYFLSYMCFSVADYIDNGIYKGVALLLVFSLSSVLGILFYTECVVFRSQRGILYRIFYGFIFAIYIVVLFISNSCFISFIK